MFSLKIRFTCFSLQSSQIFAIKWSTYFTLPPITWVIRSMFENSKLKKFWPTGFQGALYIRKGPTCFEAGSSTSILAFLMMMSHRLMRMMRQLSKLERWQISHPWHFVSWLLGKIICCTSDSSPFRSLGKYQMYFFWAKILRNCSEICLLN